MGPQTVSSLGGTSIPQSKAGLSEARKRLSKGQWGGGNKWTSLEGDPYLSCSSQCTVAPSHRVLGAALRAEVLSKARAAGEGIFRAPELSCLHDFCRNPVSVISSHSSYEKCCLERAPCHSCTPESARATADAPGFLILAALGP